MNRIYLSIKALLCLFVLVSVAHLGSFAQTTVTLTSGSSWTVPCGITSITVECWGGGGGGGAATGSSSITAYGGGGSGGAYAKGTFTVTGGTAISYSIGTGGVSASNGNPTWFNAATVLQAAGGIAGASATTTTPNASGGAAPSGNVNTGTSPTNSYSTAGGNGSSSGSGAGSAGPNGSISGGAGGASRTSNNNGNTGSAPGGGGGGARAAATGKTGGTGGAGEIIITYTGTALGVPTALTASSVTTTTATVSWTASTGSPTTYNWELRTSGAAGSGATGLTASGSTTAPTVSANVTGLTANTTYSLYVKALIGSCATAWTSAYTFTTPCTNVTLPYSQGFNSSSMPSCWSQQYVSGSLAFTFPTTGTGTPAPAPFEGTNQVMYNSYSNSTQTRLVSAPITTTGTASVDVSYEWYQSTNGGSTSYITEGVTLQYSTDGVTWTSVGSQLLRYGSTSQWTLQGATLPSGAGNQATLYIGFLFQGNSGYDSYLDLVNVKATPTCIVPTGLAASSVTSSGATVSWTAPSTGTSPTGYNWEIRTSGAGGSGSTGLIHHIIYMCRPTADRAIQVAGQVLIPLPHHVQM